MILRNITNEDKLYSFSYIGEGRVVHLLILSLNKVD